MQDKVKKKQAANATAFAGPSLGRPSGRCCFAGEAREVVKLYRIKPIYDLSPTHEYIYRKTAIIKVNIFI